SLFKLLGIGKAAIAAALPQQNIAIPNGKYATRPRMQADLIELFGKGAEQLLGQPGGTQQPLTQCAIMDNYPGFGHRRCRKVVKWHKTSSYFVAGGAQLLHKKCYY